MRKPKSAAPPDPLSRYLRGWMKLPNRVLDTWGPHLTPEEKVVWLFVARKCWGYGKYVDRIAISQIVTQANIPRRTVTRAIESLKRYELLHVSGKARMIQTFEPSMRTHQEWLSSGATLTPVLSHPGARLMPPRLSTKDNRQNGLEIVR